MPYLQSFQAGGKPFQIPEGLCIDPFAVSLKLNSACFYCLEHRILFKEQARLHDHSSSASRRNRDASNRVTCVSPSTTSAIPNELK